MSELYFKTNAQLKSIIGRDLINDDNIAVLELVKNSFDANAKRVDIIFKNLKENDDNDLESEYTKETSRIIIRDDGVGMDIDDIENKWLNIAYSEKKEKLEQHHRRMAGAKGVGRFSCDRLGQYLKMYAKTENSGCVLLKVDWSKFEIDEINKEIQSVPVECKKVSQSELELSGYRNFDHGVILEIIKLRSIWSEATTIENWNVEKLQELKRNLEKLINPSQAFSEGDFNIYLQADEFIKENQELEGKKDRKRKEDEPFLGKIENKIFQKLNFKTTSIECESEENGTIIKTTLKDKGKIIYWIKEKSNFYPQLKNIKITLYYLSPSAKAFFTKQTGVRPIDYGSIFLFLNGFRIPPYGDSRNDWLSLEQRKGQGYARFLSMRELVGQVEIIDGCNAFQIVSSREGLVNNENYMRLTDKTDGFFISVLKRLESYVVDGLKWDSIDKNYKNTDIEKQIIEGNLSEADIPYAESDREKRDRIYTNIINLIKPNAKNVIELYINENLIGDKLNEKKEENKQKCQQLVDDLRNNRLSKNMLARVIEQLSQEGEAVDKQLSLFSKYNTTDETTKALEDMQSYKDDIGKYVKMIAEMQKKLEEQVKQVHQKQQDIEELKQQKQKAEQKAAVAEVKQQKAEHELEREKKQGIFQRSIIGREKEQILGLQHQISHSSGRIKNNIKQMLKYINENNIEISEKMKKYISVISLESAKIESISNFVTNANFDLKASEITQNIVQFIQEYIDEIYLPETPVLYTSLKIKVIKDIDEYVMSFRPLEITTMVDNFMQNAEKAGAKNIILEFNKENGKFQMIIKNDGQPIPSEYKSRLFELGFTTTNGSGIGLFNVKTMVDRIKGTIDVQSNSNGVIFKITL